MRVFDDERGHRAVYVAAVVCGIEPNAGRTSCSTFVAQGRVAM